MPMPVREHYVCSSVSHSRHSGSRLVLHEGQEIDGMWIMTNKNITIGGVYIDMVPSASLNGQGLHCQIRGTEHVRREWQYADETRQSRVLS